MMRFISVFLVVFYIYCNQYGNCKLKGEILYKKNKKVCSKMACRCCNTCYVPLEIVTGKDTVELWVVRGSNSSRVGNQSHRALSGDYEGGFEQLVCNFNECDSIGCFPLSFGAEYQANGYWRHLKNRKGVFVIKTLPVVVDMLYK
jgi:hypothetical protein